MAVSEYIYLGDEEKVEIGNIPYDQYAKVTITIGSVEVLRKTLGTGESYFSWNLNFSTDDLVNDDFEKILDFFSMYHSSIVATMKVDVFFSTGVQNLLRGGEYEVDFILPNNEKTKPEISTLLLSSFLENNKATTKYVQGKSKLKCEVGANGRYGADIEDISVELGGVPCEKDENGYFWSGFLTITGETKVTIKVTDTRGFVKKQTETIKVYYYTPPLIVPYDEEKSITCNRYDPNEKIVNNAIGTQCEVKFGVFVTHIADVNENFTISYECISSDSTDTAISGTEEPISIESSERTDVSLLIGECTNDELTNTLIGPFDINKEYFVNITLTDQIGVQTTKTLILTLLECMMHFGGNGKRISVGKYVTKAKDNTFDSAWDIHTDKNLSANGDATISGVLSAKSINFTDGVIPIKNGGTGAATAGSALTNLGLTANLAYLNTLQSWLEKSLENINHKLENHTHDSRYVLKSSSETS